MWALAPTLCLPSKPLVAKLQSKLTIPFDIRCLSSNISSHIHCLGSNKVTSDETLHPG